MVRPLLRSALALTLAFAAPAVPAQQVPDSTFAAPVPRPAFGTPPWRVQIDEAHHNFHTLQGRYSPFARLLVQDGCAVSAATQAFSVAALSACDLLVIANAAGDDLASGTDSTLSRSAFTLPEIAALCDWVRAGGRLLLIADHAPFGAAAASLGRALGVDMAQGYTMDRTQALPDQGNPGIIEFTRAAGSLGAHPILDGRGPQERISRLIAFTGQSVQGPPAASPLLLLSAEAFDLPSAALALRDDPDAMMRLARPAAGRALGCAFPLGRGRVVVLGEAGMLTAQLILRPEGEPRRMGMNVPGTDNAQFVLNVVHWLAGLLPEAGAPGPASPPLAQGRTGAGAAAPALVQDFSGLWLVDTQETEAWRGRGAIGNHEEPVRIEQTATSLAIAVQSADPSGRFRYDLTGARLRPSDDAAGALWSESQWDGTALITRGRRLFTTPDGPKAYAFREERRLLDDGDRMQVITRIEMLPTDLVRRTEYRRAP